MRAAPANVIGGLVLGLALSGAVPARPAEPPVPTPPTERSGALGEPAGGSAADTGGEHEQTDPCALRPDSEGEWIDWTQERLFRSVCTSARWFDGFFGDARFDEQTTSVLFGRAGLGVWWSQYDRLEVPADFRANIPLPNLHERFDITVARENEDEFVEDRLEGGNVVPDFVAATRDQAWLAGFGYTSIASRRSRLRFSLGVRVGWPPAPYTQARYIVHHFFSERAALRLRETVFWRLDDGFGTTTAVDLERLLSPTLFVRWANVGTLSEATEGVRWRSDLTLYQDLPGPRALAYTALVRGETDAPVPVDRWSLRVTYRQQVYREWLFADLGVGVSWPREQLLEAREPSWGLGIRIEVFFGQWPEGPLQGKSIW